MLMGIFPRRGKKGLQEQVVFLSFQACYLSVPCPIPSGISNAYFKSQGQGKRVGAELSAEKRGGGGGSRVEHPPSDFLKTDPPTQGKVVVRLLFHACEALPQMSP